MLAGERIDCSVANDHAQLVCAFTNVSGDVDAEGRTPHYSSEFSIDVDLSCLTYGRCNVSLHVMLPRRRGKRLPRAVAKIEKDPRPLTLVCGRQIECLLICCET